MAEAQADLNNISVRTKDSQELEIFDMSSGCLLEFEVISVRTAFDVMFHGRRSAAPIPARCQAEAAGSG
jgi:hypothetical protein